MKKIFSIILLVFLFAVPFLAVVAVKNYYNRYEEIAKKHDCYPIENCKSDFNEDGKADIFLVVNEPIGQERYNYRLKIFIEQNEQNNEILNIKYDSTDNTFRTHIAVFEENGQKKLVVYDTVNKEHFFLWDGKQLLPTRERTPLELEIWKAMSLEDDTGGFRGKSLLDLVLIPILGIFYFVLLAGIIYLYFKRKSKLKLS